VSDITTTPPAQTAPAGLPTAGWVHDLGHRLRRRFWLKLIGVSAFMWLFFTAYFHMLRYPVHPVMTMPLTALDRWIPFQPSLLGVYVSLWFYVGVAPGLMLELRPMLLHGLRAAALCGVGLACFYFWPTSVPAAAPVDLQQHPAFALLHGVDAAGNACPSLHVATAVFSAFWIDLALRQIHAPGSLRWFNAAWVLAIAYSTLAIKQHVVLDVLAGALLGLAFSWPVFRHARRG
jgi:membrane-associated phospholipid phosphatase